MSLWSQFIQELSQPEYVHVLLNPIPVYGLAGGVVCLACAWTLKNRGAQAIALAWISLTALSVWPVSHYGHAGYDRVYAMSGEQAQQWLDWHERLGEGIAWIYTALAVLAALGLLSLWRLPKLQRVLLLLTLIASVTALGAGGFLSFVGGKIRHGEFREGPPPVIVAPS